MTRKLLSFIGRLLAALLVFGRGSQDSDGVGGRKRVSKEVRALIFGMVAENPTWGTLFLQLGRGSRFRRASLTGRRFTAPNRRAYASEKEILF